MVEEGVNPPTSEVLEDNVKEIPVNEEVSGIAIEGSVDEAKDESELEAPGQTIKRAKEDSENTLDDNDAPLKKPRVDDDGFKQNDTEKSMKETRLEEMGTEEHETNDNDEKEYGTEL
eukprot:Gb_17728 [translate_table: standard]